MMRRAHLALIAGSLLLAACPKGIYASAGEAKSLLSRPKDDTMDAWAKTLSR